MKFSVKKTITSGAWLTNQLGMGGCTTEYWVNSSGMNALTIYDGEKRSTWKDEDLKGHGHDSSHICAARSLFEWHERPGAGNNAYDWHEFQASQTPTGSLDPAYWWNLIYQYNTQTSTDSLATVDSTDSRDSSSGEWSAFWHMGQHMYVPDLAAHMAKFHADGTLHLARHYKAVASGDEGKTWYVAFVANPFNGNAVILHAPEVSDDLHKAKFSELEDDACSYAVALPYSQSRLAEWYNTTYVSSVDANGLSRPMPVMDAHPTYDMDEVEAYFEAIKIHSLGAVTKLHEVKAASSAKHTGSNSKVCKVFELHLSTQFQTAYQARFVYTPSAAHFDEVGRYHKYVDAQVRATTGTNQGYSRWMDDHWALTMRDTHTLDQIRFNLESAATPYHAHTTELFGNQTAGSLWAWGVSGMGIEWHGEFDYTTFHDSIGGFDFCTADTTCQAADKTCKEVAVNADDANHDDLTGANGVLPFGEEGENPI